MSKKNKHIEMTENDFNQLLGSSGFIFPRNECELDIFNKVYENYDYKLKDTVIDPNEIINGSFIIETKIINLNPNIDQIGIEELRLAARKGDSLIPDDILKRIKGKHKNSNEEGNK